MSLITNLYKYWYGEETEEKMNEDIDNTKLNGWGQDTPPIDENSPTWEEINDVFFPKENLKQKLIEEIKKLIVEVNTIDMIDAYDHHWYNGKTRAYEETLKLIEDILP